MALYLNLEDSNGLKAKIDGKALDLFKARPGKPQLLVKKCSKKRTEGGKEIVHVEQDQEVRNIFEIRALQNESKESTQFFIIRQERSWTTLNISRELLEDLVKSYNVFSHFWNVVFTFGRKTDENEFAFPGFRARRSVSADGTHIYESSCVLRRVQLHHREIKDGQSPWSIRQTGVHLKLSIPRIFLEKPPFSSFIIIAPSQRFEEELSQSLELSKSDGRAVGPWNIYRLLVAESLSGWMDYIASLEEGLKEQSQGIIYAKVGEEKENLSPLTDFKINFIDRQTLKILEDSIIDLQVILPTLLTTINGLREQCTKWCERQHIGAQNDCDCDQIIDEFDDYVREVENHVKRAESLQERAKSTAQLLSDLLSYEDAVALQKIAHLSHKESKSMLSLSAQSTKDAAAVKILTIISLIYLPSTIVSNFFSTQFIKTDDNGDLVVAQSAWIFAACAFPFTAFTIGLWYAWVRWANARSQKSTPKPRTRKVTRYNSWRSIISPRKGQPSLDPENGGDSVRSGIVTWSSGTTAATDKSLVI